VKRAAVLLAAALAVAPAAAAGDPAALDAGQPVIGLSLRGAHRAYPLSLFRERRVVNDVVGSMEVAVFHDPERNVSAAWFRTVLGEPIEFSGAAAGTVADDLTTITRWDLATGVAVGGNLQGQRLVALPLTTTSWAGWAAKHPNAGVYEAEAR
jgi:hypothetical protein